MGLKYETASEPLHIYDDAPPASDEAQREDRVLDGPASGEKGSKGRP